MKFKGSEVQSSCSRQNDKCFAQSKYTEQNEINALALHHVVT